MQDEDTTEDNLRQYLDLLYKEVKRRDEKQTDLFIGDRPLTDEYEKEGAAKLAIVAVIKDISAILGVPVRHDYYPKVNGIIKRC